MKAWLVTLADPIPSDGARPMRFMNLACELAARDHEVTLFAPTFFHQTKSQRFTRDTAYRTEEGYAVETVGCWSYGGNFSPRRVLAHTHFASRLAQAMQRFPKPECILTSLPAMSTVSATTHYGQSAGVPVVMDVIDPWPEVFVRAAPRATRPAARLLLDPLFARARTLFGRLSAITGISDAYVNWALALRGGGAIPSAAFLPAVRIGACDPARWTRTASTGPMRLVYAGALGHQYDLETILACARRLHDAGTANVDFHIAGDGPKAGAVRAAAAELPNVIFHGWLNGDALARLFSMSDVALACYRRGATQSVTYKLFDYTGSGLPILCSLPGEMSELLARENAGCFVPPEDVDALTARVTRLANDRTAVAEMSGNARRVAERDGDARVVYRRMAAFLEDVAGCGARPSRLVDEGAAMSVP